MDSSKQIIQTVPNPLCPVCHSQGRLVYPDLVDNLFGAPGSWNIRKCNDKKCNTYWLDEAPKESELYKLYEDYSTHKDNPPFHLNKQSSFLDRVRHAYIYEKYGYDTKPTFLKSLFRFIAYIHPAWRDTQEANLFYLPYKKDGLVLDVGCGAGSALQSLEKIGWTGTGIDFDEKAVDNAKNKGLDVMIGDLYSQNFKDESFDAIIMNHVIEHITEPLKLLEECKRILKKNGILVALTPNSNSRSHKLFKQNWRGLEVPRHLQIFSVDSLESLAKNAEFKEVKAFSSTQGILSIFDESKQMYKTGSFKIKYKHNLTNSIIKHIRWFVFGWLHLLYPDHDEVAVTICKK